ncbi:uncharacterized protein LOC128546059 isoform X1 [Mercenaria mercenaria]|uniref:uncharacterized protein LOC128546059 isoform X1 n=1 Tax=Mercenaria mercenaria TaxID=6596 RepID=UPI00234FA3BC|nr:uncharacterized protein LOC128546059 isoform X1 [Mercenaria mercenaria]
MGNGAGHFLQCVLILKCIIIGLLKNVCLYRGHTFSNWHSGFTFASLCFEVISVWLVFTSEDASHRKQNDDVDAVVGTNTFGFILKCLATLNTYYKELEEIKAMCSLCTVMEIGLDVLICCCYCCVDGPRKNSSKMKLPA